MPSLSIKGVEVTPEILNRFWSKVAKAAPNECWEWQAAIAGTTGYGNFGLKYPVNIGSHRFSYFLEHGDPASLSVLHKCDNRKCVNPNHLFVGSHGDNMKDMVSKGRASQLGERACHAKLKETDIPKLKALRDSGLTYKEVGEIMGVSRHQVSAIYRGKFWKHV